MPKSSNIKTCLIGFGNVGQGLYLRNVTNNSHLRSIQTNENFDLVAVVDPDVKNIGINMPEVRFTKTIKEVQDMSVDLAVISSPTSTHLGTCLQLINQLKPSAVLIEASWINARVVQRNYEVLAGDSNGFREISEKL